MPIPKRTTPSSTSRRLGSPEHKHGGASCIRNLQAKETIDKLCKMQAQNRMHKECFEHVPWLKIGSNDGLLCTTWYQ
jgi:hypothetical protein